jgi:PIN domain nuclease of toxin-antitoxin system
LRYIIDTHVLLWWLSGNNLKLSKKVREILKAKKAPVHLSDISLWEISMLHSLKRISLDRPLSEWLSLATSPPTIQLERITPSIASMVSELPLSFTHDPADRIIVATAKYLNATLITADNMIHRSKLVSVMKP